MRTGTFKTLRKTKMTEKAPALVCIDGPEDESFPVTITVRNLKGVESAITFDCIPRTVTEWAAEGDKIRAEIAAGIKANEAKTVKAKGKAKAAEEAGEQAEDEATRIELLVTDRINSDASLALRIAKGWSVTDKFAAASVAKMEDKFPGAVLSLHREYTKRVNGEREGNS